MNLKEFSKTNETTELFRNFVENNPINTDEVSNWINLTLKFIEYFELESNVYECDEGYYLYVESSEEKDWIEYMYYLVENTETTVDYIFEGRVYF